MKKPKSKQTVKVTKLARSTVISLSHEQAQTLATILMEHEERERRGKGRDDMLELAVSVLDQLWVG